MGKRCLVKMYSKQIFLLIDADEESFNSMESGRVLRLGTVIDKLGCAALPPLAEQRMRSVSAVVRKDGACGTSNFIDWAWRWNWNRSSP